MGHLAVRVVPRSERRGVALVHGAVVVRVVSAPQDGKATEEARRALTQALGTAPSGITLRRGRRSREKVFDVADMTEHQALQRLQAR